jgi:hypothetical protein
MDGFLSEVDWVRRATARIHELDRVMQLCDAAVLAAAIAQRAEFRYAMPEVAVERMFVREGRDIGLRRAA